MAGEAWCVVVGKGDFMKEEIEDRFLTAEEEKDIEDSLREFDDEKTISLEKLKEELCLN